MAALIASNGRIVFSPALAVKAARLLQRESLGHGTPNARRGSSAVAIATIVSPVLPLPY